MTTSPYCTIGPFFPASFVDGCNDLTLTDGKCAKGPYIALAGRVLEEGGKPTRNTIVEIWQPDVNGIFRNPQDPRFADADPGFLGWGRAKTDAEGNYRFLTVVPGAYPEEGMARCPHANLMILAIGLTRRLVTTVFFSEAPAQVNDPVLNCVDPAVRDRLFAKRDPEPDSRGLFTYRFDLILRGENETPFFLD
jgi:protocatechuate 3,4-dioxygenase beta subunit